MKNLYEPQAAAEIRERLARLRADSPRQWGTMTPAQAVAHCAGGMEMAVGDMVSPRKPLGRIAGFLIKPLVLGNDSPMRRNTPTVESLMVADDRDLDAERGRLTALIDRFTRGPEGCTTHPHSFFGRMTPEQWAILMYKHLDHHLRQFGA